MPSALTELALSLHRAGSRLQAVDDIAEAGLEMPAPLRGICVQTARELVDTAHSLLQAVTHHRESPATGTPGAHCDPEQGGAE